MQLQPPEYPGTVAPERSRDFDSRGLAEVGGGGGVQRCTDARAALALASTITR